MKLSNSILTAILISISVLVTSTVASADDMFSCFERSTKEQLSKAIGGQTQPKSLELYPWMVNLFHIDADVNFCGGSLINKNLVLTAAHCLLDKHGRPDIKNSQLLIRQSAKNGEAAGESRTVKSMVTHPEYNPKSSKNDIALILLDDPFKIGDHEIVRMLNPKTAKIWGKSNDCAKAIGWGLDDEIKTAKVIREVDLKITSKSSCNKQWKANRTKGIPDSAICAGYDTVKKDVCSGDSGGPLFIKGGPTKYLLAGLVSYGAFCKDRDVKMTGIYTRVSHYNEWIRETAKGM